MHIHARMRMPPVGFTRASPTHGARLPAQMPATFPPEDAAMADGFLDDGGGFGRGHYPAGPSVGGLQVGKHAGRRLTAEVAAASVAAPCRRPFGAHVGAKVSGSSGSADRAAVAKDART